MVVKEQWVLDAQLEQEKARAVAAEEELERVQDEASALSAKLDSYSGLESERRTLNDRLVSADAAIKRLEQEAEIREEHQRILETQATQLAVQQLRSSTMSPLLAETFARLYAVAIGTLESFPDFQRRVSSLKGIIDSEGVAALIELSTQTSAAAQEITSDVIDLFSQLGVPEHHVVDSENLSDDLPRHMAAYKSLIRTKAYADEVARLDEESRDEVTGVQLLAARWLKLVKQRKQMHRRLDAVIAQQALNDANLSDNDEPVDAADELVRPGDPWPYLRGEDVWVLSSLRRGFVGLVGVPGE